VEAKPKISAPQAQGARRSGGHTIPPRLAAETNKQGSGELLEDADYQRSREEAEAHERARDAAAAERLREYIAGRKGLKLDDVPPTMPGTEWRGASEGGWNLWEMLEDGRDKKTRYAGYLAPETWAEIRAGAGVRGVDRGDRGSGDIGDGDGVSVKSQAEMPTLTAQVLPTDLPTEKHEGEPLSAHEKTVGETLGKQVGNSLGNPLGKPVGISVGKLVGNPQNQQLTGNQSVSRPRKKRADFFRYELDFRPLKKGGYNVLIRKRLRWSDARYSNTVVRRKCPRLTAQMVAKIRVGKFTDAAVSALRDGGIEHGFITQLLARIGKGNGQRRADLTDYERSILTGIEFVLASSRGSRDVDTDRGSGRSVDVPGDNLPDASDDGDARVSYVH
jgi:hypothetical protein